MKVVVTGGAGFIGANLVGTLIRCDAPIEVVVIDNLATGSRGNLEGLEEARLIEGSILDPDLLNSVLEGADAVVHLAAIPSVPRSIDDPVASHEANATGTLHVLEAARRAGGVHTIVASSSSVYGANPTLPKSEDLRTDPLSPYAVSKLATESYALAYQNCYDLPTLAFRFFNVFGPLQAPGHAYAAVIPTFIDHALRGLPIPVHGDGKQSRDFTYVGSLVAVLVDAILKQVTSLSPVNLAFGSRRTLNEVIAELERQLDRELVVENQEPRPGDVRHSQADQGRLRGRFPNVEPFAFDDGLAKTLAWFRTRAGIPA